MNSTVQELNSNLFPVNLNKKLFTRADKYISSRLAARAATVCRNTISNEYISYSLREFTNGIIYKSEEDLTIGFVIWKEYTDQMTKHAELYSYIHILLICAEENNFSFGTRILEDIDNYSIQHGFKYIQLEPATEQLRIYYSKRGYMSELYSPLMRKELPTPIRINRITNGRRATTRRRKNSQIQHVS